MVVLLILFFRSPNSKSNKQYTEVKSCLTSSCFSETQTPTLNPMREFPVVILLSTLAGLAVILVSVFIMYLSVRNKKKSSK